MEDGAASPPKRRIVGVALAAALIGGGYFGYDKWKASRPLEWSGTVEVHSIEVGSRSGGRVKEVLVHEGEEVEAGQTLVVLEPGDLSAQLVMAEASLEQARAAQAKLTTGARPEELEQASARTESARAALTQLQRGARSEEVLAAKARLAAQQALVDKAKLDVERVSKLYDAGATSKSDLDAVKSAQTGLIAQRDALQETLNQLQNGARFEEIQQAKARAKEAEAGRKLVEAGARSEDLAGAAAQVKAAEGRLQQVKIMIDELTIKSPRAARVETLELRPGDLLAPAQTAAVLLEADQLFLRIYIPETQLGFARVGDKVPVFVDSFPNRPFQGVIQHVDVQGQYSPRNLQTADERANQVFAARVDMSDGKDVLRAGMAAFIRVPK